MVSGHVDVVSPCSKTVTSTVSPEGSMFSAVLPWHPVRDMARERMAHDADALGIMFLISTISVHFDEFYLEDKVGVRWNGPRGPLFAVCQGGRDIKYCHATFFHKL